MALLATNKEIETAGGSGNSLHAAKVVNGDIIYKGALVGIAQDDFATTASRGYAVPVSNTANITFAGVALRQVTGDTGATPVPEVEIDTSGVLLKKVTVTGVTAQLDVGKEVYPTTDNVDDLDINASTFDRPIGFISRWYSSTTCDVQLYSMNDYEAS